jgi:hypothetical protein
MRPLPVGEPLSAHECDLERTDDARRVVRVDAGRGRRIDETQTAMQRRHAVAGGPRVQHGA